MDHENIILYPYHLILENLNGNVLYILHTEIIFDKILYSFVSSAYKWVTLSIVNVDIY
jgi:hypothetical protein